jgi:hypothetical protein
MALTSSESICRIVKTCLLQGVDRVRNEPLQALNLRLLLSNRRFIASPLSAFRI